MTTTPAPSTPTIRTTAAPTDDPTADSPAYPTWVRVNERRWESEEQIDGTPDFIATREPDGWRLKARSSAQATRGFRTMTEVRNHVTTHWT